MKHEHLRVQPGVSVRLAKIDPDDTNGFKDKDDARETHAAAMSTSSRNCKKSLRRHARMQF